MVARIRQSLTQPVCYTVLQALVTSRIEYCVATLHGISEELKTKLQRVINSARRLEQSCSSGVGEAEVDAVDQKWLTVDARISLRLLLLVHTALFHAEPFYLAQMLSPVEQVRSHRSVAQELLQVRRTRTEMGKRAFATSAPTCWNALPLETRRIWEKKMFRNACVQFVDMT